MTTRAQISLNVESRGLPCAQTPKFLGWKFSLQVANELSCKGGVFRRSWLKLALPSGFPPPTRECGFSLHA